MAITAAQLNVAINVEGAQKAKGELNSMSDAVDKTESKTKQLGGGMLGLSALIGGVFTYGANQAIGFGEQMANVNSIIQVSSDELAILSDEVLDLASASGQGPETLAAGLYDIASSGFAGAEGLKVLEAAAYSATAGLTTTDVAAKGITAVLNAYNLSADDAAHVSDVMFATVDRGVISFEELSANMGNVLPLANALSISFEEVGAAYALMTKSGIDPSQAETQIAALMRSAINPTTELTEAVQAYGYTSVEALIASEGLTGYLELLTIASGGTTEGLFALLGTAEATNAALTLGGENAGKYAENLDYMQKSSEGLGATQIALQKQMESSAFSLRLLKTNVQAAAIAFGVQLEPAIRAIAKGMTTAIKGFLNLSKPIQQVIGYVTAFVGVLAGAAGAWIVFGSQITAAVGLFLSLLGPIALVAGAIAGLYLAWDQNLFGIQDITRNAFEGVMGILEPVTDFLGRLKDAWDQSAPTSDVMAQINEWGGLASNQMSLVERAMSALDIATGGLVTRLREMTAVDVAVTIGGWIISAAQDLGSAIWDWITGTALPAVGSFIASIPSVAVNILGWVVSAASDLWTTVKEWVTGAGANAGLSGDGTGGATPAGSVSIGDVAAKISGWIVSAAVSVATAVSDWVTGTAIPAIAGLVADIGSVALRIVDWFVADAPSMWSAVTEFVGLAWSTISGGVVDLVEAVKTSIDNFVVTVNESAFWAAVESAVEALWTVSDTSFESFKVKANEFGQTLGQNLTGWLIDGISGGVSSGGGGGDGSGMGGGGGQNLATAAMAGFNEFIDGFIDGIGEEIQTRLQEKMSQEWADFKVDLSGMVPDITWPTLPGVWEIPLIADLRSLLDSVTGLLDDISWSFTIPMPDIDWPDPPSLDSIPDWIKDPVGWVQDQLSGDGDAVGGVKKGQALAPRMLVLDTTSAIASLEQFRSTAQSVAGDLKAAFSSIDTSGFVTGLADAKARLADVITITVDNTAAMAAITAVSDAISSLGGGGLKGGMGPSIVITGDNTAAMQAIGDVTAGMSLIDGLSSTVILLGDNGDAMRAIGDVSAGVVGIDGLTATIYILGDNSDAMAAIRAVQAYNGTSLGSATFSVNTITTSSPAAVGAGMASGMLQGWDRATGTRSPSTEMIKRGQYLFQGLDIGWTGSASNLPIGFDIPSSTVPLRAGGGLNGGIGSGGGGQVNHIDARFINNAPIYGVEDLNERFAQHTNDLADAMDRHRLAMGVK